MATRIAPTTPGASEFSSGPGIMPNPDNGYVPTNEDQLRALHRLNKDPNSIDATVQMDYSEDVKEGLV